jgi:hypothetical protein
VNTLITKERQNVSVIETDANLPACIGKSEAYGMSASESALDRIIDLAVAWSEKWIFTPLLGVAPEVKA